MPVSHSNLCLICGHVQYKNDIISVVSIGTFGNNEPATVTGMNNSQLYTQFHNKSSTSFIISFNAYAHLKSSQELFWPNSLKYFHPKLHSFISARFSNVYYGSKLLKSLASFSAPIVHYNSYYYNWTHCTLHFNQNCWYSFLSIFQSTH